MKHVAIIGSALSGNKGAAAMLESSIQTLNKEFGEKNIRYTLLSIYPHEDAQQNPYKNLAIVDAKPLTLGIVINTLSLLYRLLPPIRSLIIRKSSAIAAIQDADVLLDQGGITFVDGREKFLLYNIASILPALLLKTPVIKCAQALGPFKNPINRFAAKLFLPRMAAIISRGAITQEYLDELQLTNVTPGADYAFLLELTSKEEKAARQKFDTKVLAGKQIVGVSPSVVMKKKVDGAGGDYATEIVNFIDYLDGEGYGVMLVPHSVRTGTNKTHNNDLMLCTEIYQRLQDRGACLFLDKELPSQELRYFIGQCDYFVASRFHAMVSSLSMAVPTLVIGWSHKYREVLDMFELSEWAFGQNKLSQSYLRKEFARLVTQQAEIKQKLQTHLPEVKKLSEKQVQVIADVVNG